jgi:hypothetical protein
VETFTELREKLGAPSVLRQLSAISACQRLSFSALKVMIASYELSIICNVDSRFSNLDPRSSIPLREL